MYYNGDIMTMCGYQDMVEAVLVENGRIKKIGRVEELRLEGEGCQWVDLNGAVMLPGFLDAHSHFISYATSLMQVDLDGAESIDEIRKRVQRFIREHNIPAGQWVKARGYDHNFLQGRRHPDLQALDEMSPEHPLVIQHQSGHVGLLNSAGLDRLGITSEMADVSQGMIGYEDGKLTGYLEESAFIEAVQKIPMESQAQFEEAMRRAQEKYLSYGITTMQEGMVMEVMLPFMQYAASSGFLKLDYVAYLDFHEREKLVPAFEHHLHGYENHFRIGGYKVFLDGSPQSRTAWVTVPYEGSSEQGYPILKDEIVEEACEVSVREGIQLLAHCNGDAACRQFIDAYAKAVQGDGKELKEDSKDTRPVLVHAQLLTREQLREVKALGMFPSFFVGHVYYWGDIHLENLGCQRAKEISPLKSASAMQIRFSLHTDAPVTQPDMLHTVWCAVNRITKKGVSLGSAECISPYQALRGVTIDAAYQYHEEKEKGTIEPGKRADFVILSQNPLKVDPDQIRMIQVLETIKDGVSVYKSPVRT